MKLRTNVFIRADSGEFLLSRDLAEISTKHRAQAVVVGTYAVASKKVYLTTRVINVSDGRVLSSYDYDIPITSDVFKMLLKGKSKMGWL
jgi:TolB-like protein